jgi:hypothetical protein
MPVTTDINNALAQVAVIENILPILTGIVLNLGPTVGLIGGDVGAILANVQKLILDLQSIVQSLKTTILAQVPPAAA